MTKDENSQGPDDSKKTGWEASKLRKLKTYTYVQNKLESLMKRDSLLVDTLNGKRIDFKSPSRENYDLALATNLIRSGKLTDDEIKIILRNFFRHGRGSTAPDEYFDKTLNRAHETIQGVSMQEPLSPGLPNPISAKNYVESFLSELNTRQEISKKREKNFYGLDTGFPLLNEYTGGIREQSLIFLLGKSGCGKTAFALQIASELARREKAPCLYLSFTQSFFSHGLMLNSRLSGIPHQSLSRGVLTHKQQDKLMKVARNEIDDWGDFLLFMEANDTKSLPVIRSTCEDIKPKFLIIDSLEYVPSGKTPYPKARIDEICAILSRFAIELNMGIMVTSSLGGKAALSDYTGGDIILYLHETTRLEPPELSLTIMKNRFGEKDKTLLYEFSPKVFEFREKGFKEHKDMYIETM